MYVVIEGEGVFVNGWEFLVLNVVELFEVFVVIGFDLLV